MHMFLRLVFAVVIASGVFASAVFAQAEFDAMSPKTDKNDALALPLSTITIATNSLEETLFFYRDGFGLTVEGPVDVDDAVKAQQRTLWDLEEDEDWDLYLLSRPGTDNVATIRLLVFQERQSAQHQSWSAMELGTFSIGMANLDTIALDKKLRSAGYGALNEIEIYDVPRTNGVMYEIQETIFTGPDFVRAVGITRGDGMPQLSGVNPETGLGGPSYSAQIIENSDRLLAFYTDVLGMELRSDRVWESAGSDGALNVPDGTVFRFSIVFAKGYGPGGHLLFVEYQNREPIRTGVEPRLPNRGIGLWSFPTNDLDQILENAKIFGADIMHGPVVYTSPDQGPIRVATLRAPNNFLVEIFEVMTE